MKKKISLVLSIFMVAGLFGGCAANSGSSGASGAAAGTIKIAVAGPMTGDNSEYGTGFLNAVQLMADQTNQAGGVLGQQVEVVSFDDKGDVTEAANVAQKIASDKSILGVIGHFSSGACMAATPTYQENQIINISPSASHPDFTTAGDYIFRNNTVISTEAGVALDLAVNTLGGKKLGMLAIKTDWGTSTGDIVKQLIDSTYASQGVSLVDREDVVEGSDDYSSNVSKLQAAGADVIIGVGMYNTLAPFAKQYKAVNPNIGLVGFSNAYSDQLIQLGGDAVEGLVFPTIFFSGSTDPKVKAFVDAYKAKYGSAPSSLTAQAYDSMGILLEAIKAAGSSTDRAAIRDKVASSNYDGVTGPTKFDADRNAIKSFSKVKVENGQFVEIK